MDSAESQLSESANLHHCGYSDDNQKQTMVILNDWWKSWSHAPRPIIYRAPFGEVIMPRTIALAEQLTLLF
jgi:hypothetical protein